jgi:hypothetical protein
MPRLKNQLNDKDRKTQVVQTSGSIVYKIPLGNELPTMGHFVSQEVVDGMLVIRYATKTVSPTFRIEEVDEFTVKFN